MYVGRVPRRLAGYLGADTIAPETSGLTSPALVPATPTSASADYFKQLYAQIGGGDPAYAGGWYYLAQLNTGDPYLYNVAIDRGLIPRTYEGFLTMAAYVSGGALATGSPAWMQFVNDYLLAMNAVNPLIKAKKAVEVVGSPALGPQTLQLMRDAMAGKSIPLPPAPSLLDASNAKYNAVTKQWVPNQFVVSYGEQPDGTIKLVTSTWSDVSMTHPAGTWTWAGPNYTAPTTRYIKSILYDFVLKATAQDGKYQEEAETQTNTMSDGSVQRFPWIPNSQWTTPAALQAAYTLASIPNGQGNPPATSTVRVRFWPALSPSEQDTIQADLAAARGGKVLYDAPGSGGFEQPGVTWADLIAAPVAQPTGAAGESLPPPPPGSELHIAAPGTGEQSTIKLPGSSVFVPVSTVPLDAWKAPPAVVGQTQAPVTVNYPDGTQTVTDTPISSTTGQPLQAGLGGLAWLGILAIGGALLVGVKRKRTRTPSRPRGYRRY